MDSKILDSKAIRDDILEKISGGEVVNRSYYGCITCNIKFSNVTDLSIHYSNNKTHTVCVPVYNIQ